MQKLKLLTSLILVLTFSTTSCAKKVDETAPTKTEVETSVETKVDKEKVASQTTDSPSSKLDYLPQILEDQGLDFSGSAGEGAELTEVERKRLIATAKGIS